MPNRVWNFDENTNGRPSLPPVPPAAPSSTPPASGPPLTRPQGIPQYQPPLAQAVPRPAAAGAASIAGPPILGAPTSGDGFDAKKPRWGLRLLGAFVAGGVLAGGGFAAGQLLAEDSVAEIETTATPAVTPAGSQNSLPDIILTPPDVDTEEPAAFVASVLGPSIVQVETELGVGSGIVFEDGLIVTNHHVIANATQIRVRTFDGRTLTAGLIGSDSRVDVAVLDVGPDSGLPVAELALDEELEVGQAAFALGSPFELQQSISAGIVSAVNRPVSNGEGINAMIQSDTSVNPGNSGGALADRSGRVIGINTSIRTDGVVAGSVGISFSIPIDTAMSVATRLINGDSLTPGFLGVSSAPDGTSEESGVVVNEVTPGSGAEDAGLLAGDRVIRIDGTPVTSLIELAGLVRAYFPGDVVELEIVRGDERIVIQATLGEP